MNLKKSGMLTLLGMLIGSFVLISGCIHCEDNTMKLETQTQIIEDITAREAYTLIQNNKDNPNFVLLDVRTLQEFTNEHLENAINLDYYAEAFPNALNELDRNKIYLIYCRSGRRSASSLSMMKELGFREAYNMLGGIIQFKGE